MTNDTATAMAFEPTIKPIATVDEFYAWTSFQQLDGASVARIPLAQRVSLEDKSAMAGFDNGDWQYDPWFTQWSQGGHGQSADGARTAANVYNFSFWHYLDICYYFGHQLLTIPPTVWTNAAHKNGVRCLGTLNLNDLPNVGAFVGDTGRVSATLSQIASYYGFDGYLFNYEGGSDIGAPLKTIMANLRTGGLTIVWYDSPISNGGWGYANRLTDAALPFFVAAGAFQANYWWGPVAPGTDDYPQLSLQVLRTAFGDQKALALRNQVCMMMDCYRGSEPYSGNFFPALKLVVAPAPLDFYTGLGYYAPGWVLFKGLDTNTQKLPARELFHNNDRAFWAGTTDFLDYPQPGDKIDPRPDKFIAYYVKERSVITATPFVTWFNGGEGDFYKIEGQPRSTGPWNNLSDQSVLPTWQFRSSSGATIQAVIDYGEAFTGGSSVLLTGKIGANQPAGALMLYGATFALKATQTLSLTVKSNTGPQLGVYPVLDWQGNLAVLRNATLKLINGWAQFTYAVPAELQGKTLTAIGIQIESAAPTAQDFSFWLGHLAMLDSAQPIRPPWIRSFPPADLLNWSDGYDSSSHYRVYGVLGGVAYLIGIVYNSVYAAIKNVFNSDITGYTEYVVQEVNAAGEFTPLPS